MVAEVIINSHVKTLNKVFDYQIPERLVDTVKIGSRVLVPFGQGGKMEEGFVVEMKEASEYKVKEIAQVEEKQFLKETSIQLAEWMAKRYFCNVSDGIKLCLPPGTASKHREKRMKEKTIQFARLNQEKEEIEKAMAMRKDKNRKTKKGIGIFNKTGRNHCTGFRKFSRCI